MGCFRLSGSQQCSPWYLSQWISKLPMRWTWVWRVIMLSLAHAFLGSSPVGCVAVRSLVPHFRDSYLDSSPQNLGARDLGLLPINMVYVVDLCFGCCCMSCL